MVGVGVGRGRSQSAGLDGWLAGWLVYGLVIARSAGWPVGRLDVRVLRILRIFEELLAGWTDLKKVVKKDTTTTYLDSQDRNTERICSISS